jgi:hypothetical protein
MSQALFKLELLHSEVTTKLVVEDHRPNTVAFHQTPS